MNSYDLSRKFFDWSFENPDKITPTHVALYFFCIEHCNRLGWKEKFGLPTTMAKEAIGVGSYNTYIKVLKDLIEWGFLKLIKKSTNQYSSNIIALSNFNKATNKALDKALIKHTTKQVTKQGESNSSINKQDNKEQETKNNITEIHEKILSQVSWKETVCIQHSISKHKIDKAINDFFNDLILKDDTKRSEFDYRSHFINWIKLNKDKYGTPKLPL